MITKKIQEYLNGLDNKLYKHASNILAKHNNWNKLSEKQQEALPIITKEYYEFSFKNKKLIGYSDKIITQRVELLNNYYDFIAKNNYDNVFTSQGKFRPTIIEEFMYILFRDLIDEKKQEFEDEENLKIGSSRAYTNLFFSGTNFKNFVEIPQIGINQKDQDFAIFRPIDIKIGNSEVVNTNLPIVAIENKTYIDKTMLDGSIATAEKIKSGNPYSLYFIVTETYDVDLTIDPVYSKIDQIYILRKSKPKKIKNKTQYNVKPIHSDVLIDLVNEVKEHLGRDWSNVENKMKKEGKII